MRIATISRRWAQGLAVAASALMLVPGAAPAQEAWPKKQAIKAIVPFGGGSSTDIIARVVLDQVSKDIGQTIVVENTAGAAGTRGSGMVAKADPDGYTLLVHSSSHTVTPSTFSKLPYDTEKDLLPVMPLATIPNVVLVSTKKGWKTLNDMVKAALVKPGSFNFASAGAGSATHLTAERLKISAKFQSAHLAFKGSNDALTEILADRIDFYCSPINAAIGHIKAGTMTALAVSSAKRSSALPDVPTTVEAGFPDSGYEFWIGAFLPGKTPEDIRTKLHAAFVKAIDTPAVAERLAKLGAEPHKISPQEFAAMIKREIAANAAVVKAAGIKVN
ncbi:MAG: tripartite tricarboxylate transporter substrate-binding protein [Hyphomicrobiaceae bacterium]